MEKEYSLISYFSEKDIQEIYDYLVEYSIRVYEQSLSEYNISDWKSKYKHALKLKTESLNRVHLSILPTNMIEAYLTSKQEKYKSNLLANKTVTEECTNLALIAFKNGINTNASQLKKASYIFDFVTQTIQYARDYQKYCLNVPQLGRFEFDFHETMPIDHTADIYQMIIQNQGTSDEICNLISFLGSIIGLQIKPKQVLKNGKPYTVNILKIGKKSTLIDATKAIKGKGKKGSTFLVSSKKLHIEFKEDDPEEDKTTDISCQGKDKQSDIKQVIENLEMIRPKRENINPATTMLEKKI